MKLSNLIIIWIIFSCMITSCSNKDGQYNFTDTNIKGNDEIAVFAPPQVNTFRINDFVTVVVQNNSEHEIAITQNGISLSLMDGNGWIRIDNTVEIRDVILQTKRNNKDFSLTMIVVFPKVVKNDRSVIVRINITGIDQFTAEKVQGYVDVMLSP
jgi:hypothetical protein